MHQLKVMIIKVFLILVGYLPTCNKLIIFESFSGKQYSCNPKAIYEYLVENEPYYNMYWSVDKRYINHFKGKELKIVKRYSLKWLLVLGFSKYWIVNSRMPATLPKPKHTTYIQTWHGTPLKKLVFDMKEIHMPWTTTEDYKSGFYKESRNWDYLISPNSYASRIFKSAFLFEKELLECGYPRNDILYIGNNFEYIKKLKKSLGIPLGKKVILYAPTWRDDQIYKVGHYKFEMPLDFDALQKKYSDDCVILLRMHYLIAECFDLSAYQGFIYDFSQVVDINELYLVSDLLITDYSSVFFDYANLRRPIIFYCYDIEVYRDRLRGFYFNIEREAMGPVVRDMDALISVLEIFNQEGVFSSYDQIYHDFCRAYCYLEDGHSTKRFIQHIGLDS